MKIIVLLCILTTSSTVFAQADSSKTKPYLAATIAPKVAVGVGPYWGNSGNFGSLRPAIEVGVTAALNVSPINGFTLGVSFNENHVAPNSSLNYDFTFYYLAFSPGIKIGWFITSVTWEVPVGGTFTINSGYIPSHLDVEPSPVVLLNAGVELPIARKELSTIFATVEASYQLTEPSLSKEVVLTSRSSPEPLFGITLATGKVFLFRVGVSWEFGL